MRLISAIYDMSYRSGIIQTDLYDCATFITV